MTVRDVLSPFFVMYWLGRLRHPRAYREHMARVEHQNYHLDLGDGSLLTCPGCDGRAKE